MNNNPKSLRKIRALIFDAEGVLIDTEPLWDMSQEAFLQHYGKTYERNRVKSLLTGRSLAEGTAVLAQIYALPGPLDELIRQRQEIVQSCFQTNVTFIPGARAFLARFGRKLPFGIATSMDPDMFLGIAEKLDLLSLFPAISTLHQTQGRGKPAPALFLDCAARLNVAPVDCLVIEDAPLGIEAARRAGMLCAALTTTYEATLLEQADVIVHSFDEFGDWLASHLDF
ncbi:HAD family hydrolase [Desulfovibrio inopinatus]|uniref:HAD family hydrolase n=1 Tax=Desulfovibrio inopinatus TaxID=102109 RepID=UPI000421880C|nr:HAD family phosphatase [Desulfovibrio inopinatus]